MASIKDPHAIDWFRGAMEDIHSKLLVQTSGEITEAAVELSQAHKNFMKSAVGMPYVLLCLFNCLGNTVVSYQLPAYPTLPIVCKKWIIASGI